MTKAEWIWARGSARLEGEHVLWFEPTTSATSSGSAASVQSFEDFVTNGPAVGGVPRNVSNGLRLAIHSHVQTQFDKSRTPRNVRIGIPAHGREWARASAAGLIIGVVGPFIVPLVLVLAGLRQPEVGAALRIALVVGAIVVVVSFVVAVLVWRARGPGSGVALVVWIAALALAIAIGAILGGGYAMGQAHLQMGR